jgi:hypothetical protein
MRRAGIPAIVLPALLLLSPQVALAAKPSEHIVFKGEETIPGAEICGIPATIHLEGHANILAYEDKSAKGAGRRLETWTNAEGDWLQLDSAGHFRVQFEEGADGLLTVTETISGVNRFRSAAGITAAFDRGRLVNVIVIQQNPPEGPEGDVFISFETVFAAGQHQPENVFCDVVADVLG